jgi:hypothetical protein
MGERLFSGWGCGPWRRARAATTRSATTSARSGPSTTPSSPGGLRRYGLRGSGTGRRGHPGGGGVLRRSAPRSLRRLPTLDDQVPGPVPDRVQSPGLVHRRAAAAAGHDAGPGAGRRAFLGRSRPCPGPSAVSSCWTSPVAGAVSTPSPAAASTPLLRPGTARALATARQPGQPDRSSIIEGQGRQRSPALTRHRWRPGAGRGRSRGRGRAGGPG